MSPKTLRGKFTIVYIGLALLALLVGLAGIWNTFRLEQSIDNLMTANYKSIDAVSHMTEAIERQDSGMLICLAVGRDAGLDIFTENGDEFRKWYYIELGNVTEAGEHDVLGNLDRHYSEYSMTIYRMLDAMDAGEAAAGMYYTETVLPMVEQIKSDCGRLTTINEQAMFASKQRAVENAKLSMVFLLLITLVAVIGGYLVARYFILKFLDPIRRLSEGILRVREGDLNQHVDVRTNDEAGKLAAEFNNMTRRLQEYEQSSLGTLMAEQKKTMAIVRSISDPLLVLDANWRILLVNDACARFFGLDAGQVSGRHFLEAISNGELFADIERLAAGGEDLEDKIIRIQKGEDDFYFNLTVAGVNEPGGCSGGIIAALQNVTGLKELENVKSDFLAAVSHEFKTPLTSIMMATSMLEDGSLGGLSPDQVETLRTIQMDGERLLGLVNELLELMRIESGNQIYTITPNDIGAIVAVSLSDFSDNARRRGIELIDKLPERLPEVAADFEKIRWVMNNLIGNALKCTNAGDTVAVSAGCDGGFVTVSVQDTGIGIPEEYQQRIFDRFVQVKRGAIEVGGTGLGLSIARDIVQSHGGDIRVSSQTGVGSTFTFSLPVAERVGDP